MYYFLSCQYTQYRASYSNKGLKLIKLCVGELYRQVHTVQILWQINSVTIIQAVPLVSGAFRELGWRMIYDISFFIIVTTIGLNIIFGIIVDTFSELRDARVSI